jgi:hypothetical protein
MVLLRGGGGVVGRISKCVQWRFEICPDVCAENHKTVNILSAGCIFWVST